ncbi:MAG TPA: DUF4123 domain-containing protein [Candidatus Angelobacter sp.]|nr:DUF4123 domain-containing protein [Candidatus Angelobacter sp.]
MTAFESSDERAPARGWFLETVSGPTVGRINDLRLGQTVYFGRQPDLDGAFPNDAHMSRRHFSVEFDGACCRLTDLNSQNGTFVNGSRVQDAILVHNDVVAAGETSFVLGFGGLGGLGDGASKAAGAPEAAIGDPQGRLLSLLQHNFQPLYAILDAARDPQALTLLLQSQAQYQSLYEGPKGESLSDVAPYLVQLPKDSPLLPILVQEGWGKSWGVYLKCPAEFQAVRRHLRHFLEVRQPNGEQVYFRFYDPRVLRVYLANLGPGEAGPFMGPLHCYLMEDQKPDTLLQFIHAAQGLAKAKIPLTATTTVQAIPGGMAPETYTAG